MGAALVLVRRRSVRFSNIASGARGIAKIVFFVAVAICLVVLIFGVTFGVLVF